jgi:hypothetical protein
LPPKDPIKLHTSTGHGVQAGLQYQVARRSPRYHPAVAGSDRHAVRESNRTDALRLVTGGTYLFALPGSPSACRDAWEGILVHQHDNRLRTRNFVELMPRLQEHLKR